MIQLSFGIFVGIIFLCCNVSSGVGEAELRIGTKIVCDEGFWMPTQIFA